MLNYFPNNIQLRWLANYYLAELVHTKAPDNEHRSNVIKLVRFTKIRIGCDCIIFFFFSEGKLSVLIPLSVNGQYNY